MERIKLDNGNYIEIWQDDLAESPRVDGDNLWKWICFHKRYSLGDDNKYRSSDFDSWEELEKQIKKDLGDCFIEPLAMIDHSGLHFYRGSGAHCCDPGGWDSGRIGFAVLPKSKARKEFGRLTKKAVSTIYMNLDHEIDALNHFHSGDIWGFSVLDDTGEVMSSCGGFYDHDECIKEAKERAKEESPHLKELKETAAMIS